MLAVALVALMISTGIWAERRYRKAKASYEKSLIYHRTNAAFCRFSLEAKPPIWVPNPFMPSEAERDRERRSAEYHEEMILKYESALRHPWLPVPPDPPKPE